MIRALVMGLAAICVFYLMVLALAYVFQRSLLYFPSQQRLSVQQVADIGFQTVEIEVPDVGGLESIWRVPSNRHYPVIIHFHGNGGSIADRFPIYHAMAKNGVGVLAAGYPGYGGNPGSPSEEAFYLSAQSQYDWIITQGYKPEQIVIVGQSLGTGVATWLAANNKAAGLILEAAYTGMDDMAQNQFPYLPAKLLIKDRYRSLDRIDQIDMPFSWIHGTDDGLIPISMGQKLFDAALDPKGSYLIENGGHNDLWMRGIEEIIEADAMKFVSVEQKQGKKAR